tara:strand:+ start:470 stop:1435 length:966 start_codon:yes stop_codon:yes gene_type:complete
MISLQPFKATDKEFKDLTRISNLINHDSIDHPDDEKNDWKLRDKSIIRDRLLLYNNDELIGALYYAQGRDGNNKTAFFSIELNPEYNNNGYRELLYQKMLQKVKKFNCEKLHTSVYDHPNYKECKRLIDKHGFKLVQTNREYSCDITKVKTEDYKPLIDKLQSEGIEFYDSRDQLKDWDDHYKKLEKLQWTYSKDFPIPEGIEHTRLPFKEEMKHQIDFETNYYGTEIVAVHKGNYIASTDLSIYPKSEPHKAWTGGLGVLKEYRRKGIATALKIKAIETLLKKGVTDVRTDNEENNPMYKINVALGFKPVPFSLDYLKII